MNENETMSPETEEVLQEVENDVEETIQAETETSPASESTVVEVPTIPAETSPASSETAESVPALSESSVRELLDFIKNELSADNDSNVAADDSAEYSAENADTETENEIEIMPSEESEELMETYEYSVVTDSDAEYRNTIINRLDNLLVCGMITACCAFLILFHTLKKE